MSKTLKHLDDSILNAIKIGVKAINRYFSGPPVNFKITGCNSYGDLAFVRMSYEMKATIRDNNPSY